MKILPFLSRFFINFFYETFKKNILLNAPITSKLLVETFIIIAKDPSIFSTIRMRRLKKNQQAESLGFGFQSEDGL